MSDERVLAVEHLSKSFDGVRAVRDVSFGVAAGELCALIGPNGAGKTTCFNCINGQLAPDAGRVWLAGVDVTGRAPRDMALSGVGRTFQVAATFASMTVRENVEIALLSHAGLAEAYFGQASGARRAQADALLERAGITALADRHCGALPYGDAKRVELALALAGNPKLLLMDEPTAGMAHADRGALMAAAAELARRDRVAVLFTEHDMDVVFGHADRIVVLDRGRVIADAAPEVVRADPSVQAVYLGAPAP
ncbi:MAG: ABC transporter ATP-binding protein [Betaproteobacteria bacterium]|jgi:branched-chain amino acid transport system ATP-binding protein|nr:ABC transporter ATP-binding protein [Betaproteobacteria bacterium]